MSTISISLGAPTPTASRRSPSARCRLLGQRKLFFQRPLGIEVIDRRHDPEPALYVFGTTIMRWCSINIPMRTSRDLSGSTRASG